MKTVLSLLFLLAIIFSGCTAEMSEREDASTSTELTPSASPQSELEESLPYTARFEIFTRGTKRIFTQAMYHNLSPELYIEARDPQLINVQKSNLTWNDFFKTLPFSLTKDCLVTGTKQTFCTSDTEKLRFFLNDQEVPEALDDVIKADDTLRVTYGK
ncbi:MAG: hypothetical protein M3Q81_03555 [bacterium]|nr:hypothetical protein [bacterium]